MAHRSPWAQALARGLSWTAAGFLAARLAGLGLHLIAGRLLGPAQYGQAHLALSVSDAVILLATLGLPPTLIKRLAEAPDAAAQGRAAAAALSLFTVLLAGAWAAFWAAGAPVAGLLRLDERVLVWGMAHASALGAFTIGAAALLGRRDFRRRAQAEALGSACALAAATAMLLGRADFSSFIGALCAAYALACAFCLGSSPRLTLRPPGRGDWAPFFSYGPSAAAWMAGAALVLAPGKLMLNYFCGGEQVGVYGAYFTGTVMVSMALTGIAATVLFPSSCGEEEQGRAWALLRRAAVWLALAAPLFVVSGRLFLAALADRYPVRWSWLALFAATAALFAAKELVGQVMAARDAAGARLSAAANGLAAAVQVAVGLWAVPRWRAPGAAAALAAGLAAATLCLAAFAPRRRHAPLV